MWIFSEFLKWGNLHINPNTKHVLSPGSSDIVQSSCLIDIKDCQEETGTHVLFTKEGII